MIRLISAIMRELTHTFIRKHLNFFLVLPLSIKGKHTLFADERVIPVVRVICIARRCAAAIPERTKVKLLSSVR